MCQDCRDQYGTSPSEPGVSKSYKAKSHKMGTGWKGPLCAPNDFKEIETYHWKKVTCKNCLKLKP